MSILKKMRRQTAVVWVRGEPDRNGKFSHAEPVEISCRWDDSEGEYRKENGDTAFSSATFYPDRILKIGDRVLEGALESDTPADPVEAGAFEIVSFSKTPSFRNSETLYTAQVA